MDPQYHINPHDQGDYLATFVFLPGKSKEKVGKETLPNVLIMINLEASLRITVDKDCGNSSGAIIEKFIKPRASKMFVHPEYCLDGTWPLISVSVSHKKSFRCAFGIWMGEKKTYGCCIQISVHKVCRELELREHRVEQMSSLCNEVAMRQSRVVPGKHAMTDFILEIKEAQIKAEDIPVHVDQDHTETKQLKYKDETPTVMVHSEQIK